MESIYWLILFVILLGIEILTLGLTTIWFAGGAVAAFFASLLGAGLIFQIVVFAAVSLLLLVFTRPIATKYLNRRTIKTNVESMEGRHGEVVEEINNLQAAGRVKVDGMPWAARSEREGQIIPAGTMVTVVRVSGVKLIVKVLEEEEHVSSSDL
ncbi:NfeD family protein [Hominifimenecus sp. rT4P-3]|uniref:NfeD family protein n=1 Tax=Hominifimenecus sp. rT4P-3 TaxID=3242979 RepID=UPI003DA3F543